MPEHKQLSIVALVQFVLSHRELAQGNQEDLELLFAHVLQIREDLVNVLVICVRLFQAVRQTDQVAPLVQVVVELYS